MLCLDGIHLAAFGLGVVVGALVLLLHRWWDTRRGHRP